MKKSAIIKQILTYCSSQWLDIWSILIYICLFHRTSNQSSNWPCSLHPSKVPCTALSLIWAGEEEANMAAKAGDNPDSLMTLATVFCLRNLRKTCATRDWGTSSACAPTSSFPAKSATSWSTRTWQDTTIDVDHSSDISNCRTVPCSLQYYRGSAWWELLLQCWVYYNCDFFVVLWTDTWSWSTQTVTLNQRRASSNYSQTLEAPDSPEYSWEKTSCVTEIWRPLENRWDAASWSETSFSE